MLNKPNSHAYSNQPASQIDLFNLPSPATSTPPNFPPGFVPPIPIPITNPRPTASASPVLPTFPTFDVEYWLIQLLYDHHIEAPRTKIEFVEAVSHYKHTSSYRRVMREHRFEKVPDEELLRIVLFFGGADPFRILASRIYEEAMAKEEKAFIKMKELESYIVTPANRRYLNTLFINK